MWAIRACPNSSAVKVLSMVRGPQAYPKFQQALDSVLAAQQSSKAPRSKPPILAWILYPPRSSPQGPLHLKEQWAPRERGG